MYNYNLHSFKNRAIIADAAKSGNPDIFAATVHEMDADRTIHFTWTRTASADGKTETVTFSESVIMNNRKTMIDVFRDFRALEKSFAEFGKSVIKDAKKGGLVRYTCDLTASQYVHIPERVDMEHGINVCDCMNVGYVRFEGAAWASEIVDAGGLQFIPDSRYIMDAGGVSPIFIPVTLSRKDAEKLGVPQYEVDKNDAHGVENAISVLSSALSNEIWYGRAKQRERAEKNANA